MSGKYITYAPELRILDRFHFWKGAALKAKQTRLSKSAENK